MVSDRNRRTLIVSALGVICLWLVAVAVFARWRHPQFWIAPHERFAEAQGLFERGRDDAAFRELDRAIAGDPASAGFHVFKGYRLLDRRDAAGAEQSFRAGLTAEASNVEARFGLAESLRRQQRREEAVRELEAVPFESMTAEHTRRRSQLFGALGAPAAALADLSELLHDGGGDPALLKEAVTHAITLEDWPRALTLGDWLRSRSADPATSEWISKQRAYVADRIDQASAPALDPIQARRDRAVELMMAGQRAEAEEEFRRLIASGQADVGTRQSFAWMLNVQHRYAEAWRVIEPLPRPSRDASVLELQARTAVWAGRHSDAIHLLRAYLRMRPDDPALWRELAQLAEMSGDDRGAAEALASYVRLRAVDAGARQHLAGILARQGSIEEAIQHYRALAADRPDDPAPLEALGLLYESAGQLDAAKTEYREAIDRRGRNERPELYLRLARLHRWTSSPREAVTWYERYLEKSPDAVSVKPELALALLDAGDAAAALAILQIEGQLDRDSLLTGARAASAARRPDLAVIFLERRAALAPLIVEEQLWLAASYRGAGRVKEALHAYERGAAAGEPPPEVLEAIADLRYDLQDPSGAVQALQRIGPRRDVTLKLARAAAAAGRTDIAAEQYDKVAAARPDDRAVRLEAARFFAAAGLAQRALSHYHAAATADASGLRLDLARVSLAAHQFGGAERWAREAVAAGEDIEEARLALAQSLHLQGRSRDAALLLRAVVDQAPRNTDARVWRGQVAVARDRHLSAYQDFGRALADGAREPGRVALWMSTAAQKRNDYAGALRALERAASHGADPLQATAARAELSRAAAPTVTLPGWVHADSNDLRLQQAGVGVRFFLPRLAGALDLAASSGSIGQRSFFSRYDSASLALDHVFPVPRLDLAARLGLHRFGSANNLATWRATATWHVSDEAKAGISITRQPLLPLAGPLPLRQFNRVQSVAGIGPDFFSDGVQAFFDFVRGLDGGGRVEIGRDRLRDGNRQTAVYAHYQQQIQNRAGHWTAVRPNLYYEAFSKKNPFYFSPSSHLTAGTMVHTVHQFPYWDIELELNPQLLRTEGRTGFASHGLLNVSVRAGTSTIGVGTFVFYDGLENYVQWRFGGRVTIPIGR